MIAYVALGAVNGLTVALLALGLVLVFKAGRFVNFAHAQMGVLSSLLMAKFSLDWGWAYWLAFPVAIAVGAATGAACYFLVVRRLAGRSGISKLVATIGLAQLLLAVSLFSWVGPDRRRVTTAGYPLPLHTHVEVGSLVLLGNHVLTLILVPLLTIALAVFLKRTPTGRLIRAAASNPDAAGLAGISVHRVSVLTWTIAGALSAVSAILVAPDQSISQLQNVGPTLLLEGLGAAALAGFVSLPLAFAAGVGIGVLESLVRWATHTAGTATLYVLLAILVGLFVRSRTLRSSDRTGDVERPDVEESELRIPAEIADRFLPRHGRTVLAAVVGLFAVLAPLLPGLRAPDKIFLLALTVAVALAALSLTLLTGWAGQVSLGQFAFVGLGAFVAARLSGHGWSLPACLLAAGLLGAVVAVAIGLPALRLPGLTLAVTTLGFAVVAVNWLFPKPWLSDGGGFMAAPAARVAGVGRLDSQRSVYYAALVVLLLGCLALAALRRSGPGRAIFAVRDNEAAAAAFGLSPTGVKLTVFALSGFLASAAGVLWAAAYRSADAHLFDPQQSLLLLSLPVIGGLTSVSGTLTATVLVYGLPLLLHDTLGSVFGQTLQIQLAIGGAALLLTVIANPGGLAGAARRGWEQLLARIEVEASRRAAALQVPEVTSEQRLPILRAEDVVVSFGGIRAVDHASIRVHPGEIVGLIGGNGAGKTTLLNAISGVVPIDSGSIVAFGRQLGHLPPNLRANLGLGRSFQSARLFPRLTVRQTIQVALQSQHRVGTLAALLGAPWVRFTERATRQRAAELIETFGLNAWADEPTATLSTGTRRICDLAAQVATAPRVLLLDEPTAGVAQRDAEAFGPLIRNVAADLGCAVLLIEHDMPLMLRISDRIYCMEAGRVIAEGTPEQIRDNPAVIASYLGTSEEAISRSGDASSTGLGAAGPSAPTRPRARTRSSKQASTQKPRRTAVAAAAREQP